MSRTQNNVERNQTRIRHLQKNLLSLQELLRNDEGDDRYRFSNRKRRLGQDTRRSETPRTETANRRSDRPHYNSNGSIKCVHALLEPRGFSRLFLTDAFFSRLASAFVDDDSESAPYRSPRP